MLAKLGFQAPDNLLLNSKLIRCRVVMFTQCSIALLQAFDFKTNRFRDALNIRFIAEFKGESLRNLLQCGDVTDTTK